MMRFSVLCTAAALISCGAAYAQAGGPIPRTTEGKPDFQGVWTNSSITRLERVPEFKDLVISEADAKQWEMDAASVAAADNAPTAQDKGAPEVGDDSAGYNNFWIDPGRQVGKINGTYRSSWITDPPNGKVPYTPAGRAAMMKTVSTYNMFDIRRSAFRSSAASSASHRRVARPCLTRSTTTTSRSSRHPTPSR